MVQVPDTLVRPDDTAPAESATPVAASQRQWSRLVRQGSARFALVGVWLLLVVLYGILEPSTFLTSGTFTSIFSSQQSIALIFLTTALLCTIVVGEFVDLSVPSVLALSATLVPVLVTLHGWNVWLASL